MSETRSFPFGGVPIYNPQSLSKGEALAQFHARQNVYLRLIEMLREERPSHVLVIGTRGMGKTTLLQRVRYGVEDDAALNSRYLVLTFPEEQYNVNRLSHFLLNALDALADAVEKLPNDRVLARIEGCALEAARLSREGIEELVPKFMAEIGLDLKRDFLLLVDNADRLFETIESREQWRLRDLLASRRDLTLFGATTQASEGIYGHDRAFYEFFNIQRLTPLTVAEVRELLLRLSEAVDEPEGQKGVAKQRVEQWLTADHARLRTLVQLTGGNPRTTVLLFNLVLDGLGGGAREYLEQLLDQCTPNYKGRIDELPAQAQQVLDAVALRWDPAMAMEVAADTGLDSSAVSTHLTRLVRQGILEKADAGDSKKALYQVAERFFNIWYLMRASRRVRAKLRWFVEFLRVFFDSGELEQMARDRFAKFGHSNRIHASEIETAFACVLASGADRDTFEDYLKQECAEIESDWRPYLDLIQVSVPNEIGRKGGENEIASSRCSRVGSVAGGEQQVDPNEITRLFNQRNYGDAEIAVRRAIAINPTSAPLWSLLGVVCSSDAQRKGEAEETLRKAIDLDPNFAGAWAGLGMVLASVPDRREEAVLALRRALELNPAFAQTWEVLGTLLAEKQDGAREAETVLRRAVELDPGSILSWRTLGKLLGRDLERLRDAEGAIRKAIEIDPESAESWGCLGDVLSKMPARAEDAVIAYRKATELDPASFVYWAHLSCILMRVHGRSDEAEAAIRKAIALNPEQAPLWAMLGLLLAHRLGRLEEGEAAIRKAITLSPNSATFLMALAGVIASQEGRLEETGAILRRALDLDPKNGVLWAMFGFILACRVDEPEAAEMALRKAVELIPDESETLRNLGVLLYCQMLNGQEAVAYLRRSADLDPSDPISAAVLTACVSDPDAQDKLLPAFIEASSQADFWDKLLELAGNYPPFGQILVRICDLVQNRQGSDGMAQLCRAVGYAQLGDFPRASVALEDALLGDPIDLLAKGRKALEIFLAAAVKHGRVQECVKVLDKKGWRDAWRPIYEALKAVDNGSAEYLKRVAVEVRDPAMIILRRIAPELRDLMGRPSGGVVI